MIDRSEVNRALAKAIAYKQCGKDHKAAMWAAQLIRQLECAAILTPDFRNTSIVEHE
jgi:hypothetical protein